MLSGLSEGEKVVLLRKPEARRREGGHEPARSQTRADAEPKQHDFLNGIVHVFLDNNFSIILIVFSVLIGLAALLVTAARGRPADRGAAGRRDVSIPGLLGR